MKTLLRWTVTLSLAASLVGVIGVAPSFADNYDHYDSQRNHISHDVSDIRGDQRRLQDLYRERDRAADHEDWRAVDRIERRISDLERHINQDRRDVHHDVDQARRDRDHYNQDQASRDHSGYQGHYRNY